MWMTATRPAGRRDALFFRYSATQGDLYLMSGKPRGGGRSTSRKRLRDCALCAPCDS